MVGGHAPGIPSKDATAIDVGPVGHQAAAVEVEATLVWSNLTVAAKDSKGNAKDLLKSVSGYLEPRHMLAIMGPSGCGKTTLLDTLAGRHASNVTVTGDVLLNGHKSQLSYGKSAYVTQEERLIGTLSVKESIRYAAQLRLPSSMSYADKAARADTVIQDLGLSDCADTLIGNWFLKGISGGQKRRVTIACELVTHPTLMFLDEPTSGLDAASAFHVMATIRRLAEQGRTILTVIHQPSSEVFDLFDKLTLLSSGRVVYQGDASEALTMFEKAGFPCPLLRNPTDHFLHMINEDFQCSECKEQVSKLISTYDTLIKPSTEEKVQSLSVKGTVYEGNRNEANYFYQNAVLTQRTFVNNVRNIGVFWLRLGMYVVLCIMIGTIYLDLGNTWKDVYSYTSMMFFVVAFLTFMAIAGFPAFAEDMAVFTAERKNGYYGVSVFVISNTLASMPFILGIALISSLIVYWLVGLNDDGDRVPCFIINLFTSLTVVESLMMAVAAIVPHYLMGIAMGAGILGMYMLVCGFFQPVAQLPDPVWRYPLHYMSYHAYSFGSFMQNQFGGTDGWECPCYSTSVDCGPEFAPYPGKPLCTVSGQFVLDYWVSGAGTLNKWVDIGILWAMVFIYRFIFFILLKLREKIY